MTDNILVTGGAGFIGHHLVEHLLKNTDMNIYIIDRLTYAGNLNRLVDIDCWNQESHRVKFVYHDFRANFEPVMNHMPLFKYIIHMGAESHVDRSITDPALFAESNVIGTVNVLNYARAVKPELMIYVSTDEVYGAVESGHLHKEGEPFNPSNPYSASKAGAEVFCKAFHKSYGLPVIISNTMNNFGERQDPEKFVPLTMKRMITKQPVILHCRKDKNGVVVDVSSRCWLHARNHADGLLFLLTNGVPGESYNIVGEKKTVVEVAAYIAGVLNTDFKVELHDFHSFRPGHDMHYGLDGSKMESLGWVPPLSYADSLRKTILWTKSSPLWLGV